MLITYNIPVTEQKTVEVNPPMYAKIHNYKYVCLNENGSVMEVHNWHDSTAIFTRKKDSFGFKNAVAEIVNGTPISAEEFFAYAEEVRKVAQAITLETAIA